MKQESTAVIARKEILREEKERERGENKSESEREEEKEEGRNFFLF